jgi:hypothetical protein
MTDWAKAAATQPGLADLFDRVLTSMGSMRQEAFAQLRASIASSGPGLRDDYTAALEELAELDVESTQFETRFRRLQEKFVADAASPDTRLAAFLDRRE